MSHYLHIRYNINPTLVFLVCIHFPLLSIGPLITFQCERDNASVAPWAKVVKKIKNKIDDGKMWEKRNIKSQRNDQPHNSLHDSLR